MRRAVKSRYTHEDEHTNMAHTQKYQTQVNSEKLFIGTNLFIFSLYNLVYIIFIHFTEFFNSPNQSRKIQ